MPTLSMPNKLMMVAWSLLVQVLFVGGVLLVSLLPGVSVLGALLIVSGALFLFSAANILTAGRSLGGGGDRVKMAGPRRPPPPGGSAGDRFPRRPLPSPRSGAAEQPLPEG